MKDSRDFQIIINRLDYAIQEAKRRKDLQMLRQLYIIRYGSAVGPSDYQSNLNRLMHLK